MIYAHLTFWLVICSVVAGFATVMMYSVLPVERFYGRWVATITWPVVVVLGAVRFTGTSWSASLTIGGILLLVAVFGPSFLRTSSTESQPGNGQAQRR